MNKIFFTSAFEAGSNSKPQKFKRLNEQKFLTNVGAITLIRHNDDCVIEIDKSYGGRDEEKNKSILLTMDEYEALMEILENSKYIFSRQNQ